MTQSKRIQLLLADDHASFRQSLIASIPASSPIDIVGEAADGETVVTLARELKPDVVLLDFRMPGLDGAAAAVRILQHSPDTIILIASLSFDRQYVLRSIAAGASGYIAKDDAFVCLQQAIESVHFGSYYVSPRVQEALRETAPENLSVIRQRVLQEFDQEGGALLACARRIASGDDVASHAVFSTFLAYSLALRDRETISSAQTWLVLSVAALASKAQASSGTRWSWSRPHPADSVFEDYWLGVEPEAHRKRVLQHVTACGSCWLSWSLAAFSISADKRASTATMRADLEKALDEPDEAAIFLNFAQRQYRVMQLASSELERLLGATARRDWNQRQAAAGSWLGTLLGRTAL
jgi:DNA-binding NarL/FixJ family response regulator